MSISIHTFTEQELILKAQKSTCSNELYELSRNTYSNVRRCVAKNFYTSATVVDILALDPVTNVIFAAVGNSKCTVKRNEVDYSNKCTTCKKDESTLHFECRSCTL